MTPPRHWQNAAFAVLTIAAALFLSGCNLLSTKANPDGTSGQTPSSVGLSASSLNFGSVSVGSSKTMHITVTNSSGTGGPDVTVAQAKATGTGFSTTAVLPINLAPGQSTNLSVLFKPTTAGKVSGNLTIDLVGADDPSAVSLGGSGGSTSSPTPAAQLTVTPSTLSFGSVTMGSSKNLTATLKATNSDVKVSSAAWNGSGFSLTGITFPATVKAGATVSYTVTFTPQSSGSTPGSISFVSDAANSPTGETLSGSGVQAAQQHTVNLSWVPSTSTVAGYNVYRANQSGGPYARLNGSMRTSASYADSSVQSGHTYFYVATAIDPNSVESAYSGEVAAVVPTP